MEAPASPAATSIMTAPTSTTARLPGPENHAAPVDPSLDLFAEIARLKREMNAIILAHYYQEPDIQDIADVIGDSLRSRRRRRRPTPTVIVFCGVHFMAETAKILNPDKLVLLPDLAAGCSLSDGCPAPAVRAVRARAPRPHRHHATSTRSAGGEGAERRHLHVEQRRADRPADPAGPPDPLRARPAPRAAIVIKQTGRDMVLWPGSCSVHVTFSERRLIRLKAEHPDALVLAHPECEEHVLRLADHIGSTTSILELRRRRARRRASSSPPRPGIIHQMKKACPDKTFIPAPPENGCSCNECPYMRLNTLEKVYRCMRDRQPEITMPEDLRLKCLAPLQRMLEMSAA